MRSKVDELFDLSEQKIQEAKRLMSKLPDLSDAAEQQRIEERIKRLIEESDRLSEIAEDIGTSKQK